MNESWIPDNRPLPVEAAVVDYRPFHLVGPIALEMIDGNDPLAVAFDRHWRKDPAIYEVINEHDGRPAELDLKEDAALQASDIAAFVRDTDAWASIPELPRHLWCKQGH